MKMEMKYQSSRQHLGKVTHHMLYPSYCIFVNEVGCNTDQEGDSHIGGELKIAE